MWNKCVTQITAIDYEILQLVLKYYKKLAKLTKYQKKLRKWNPHKLDRINFIWKVILLTMRNVLHALAYCI